MMSCARCGTPNATTRRFCMECGAPLAVTCPSCGSENEPGAKFCGVCGGRMTDVSATAPAPAGAVSTPSASAVAPAPVAERKLVSVLFADLVGFTAASEARDPEEVRDFLSAYFETARRIVARYGGTIEKFIGDAVMAVWGTPVAREDDADRAVRAALDLVGAVPSIAPAAGSGTAPAEVRAAVCTGEAAVTLGAEGQGMVAGDLVNTASRIQALAGGGTVLVDDATRRSTEASVVHEDAGSHEVKGRTEPVHVWRATRVIAGRGGALRSTGLESPFVGRDAELRLIKELFHASAEERKARLVSVMGMAGIGKSRLSWELYKYLDGLSQDVFWHRGRCLAYGEGVSYWALAEMVRMRAGIAETEDAGTALEKLRAVLRQFVPEDDERAWVEPRLASLIGGEAIVDRQRDDLFPAWRLFFERLAAQGPTVMVFEDLQWSDRGLLDFIDYLLEWSRNFPVFVLALARPELDEQHPGWAAGKRNFTSLSLEPLAADAMRELMDGLVPGLPEELRDRIMERAEGVPLYAVETVRMLIDRGLVVREGGRYMPVGPVESLEVPETLHALIAARLDGLAPEERRLVADAAVVGKTFTVDALVAASDATRDEVERRLGSLVRKEVLGLQADPRSPERGQYGFLQDLVRRVAYETLSRRDRKVRHLAAAAYLEREWPRDDAEVAEIVASHYLEAYRAFPDDADAGEVRAKARDALVRAGNRAASLAASAEAHRYFEQACELADDPLEKAWLGDRAGWMAHVSGRSDEGLQALEAALALAEGLGEQALAARITAHIGEILWIGLVRIAEGLQRMESALGVLSDAEPGQDVAMLAAQVARLRWFSGDVDGAAEAVDRALRIAEDLVLPEVLSQALNTKSLVARSRGRYAEGEALLLHALAIAREHDLIPAMMRALFNLSNDYATADVIDRALELDLEHLELSRRIGDRVSEWMTFAHLGVDYLERGQWDEAIALADQGEGVTESGLSVYVDLVRAIVVPIRIARGELDAAGEALERIASWRESSDMQDRWFFGITASAVHRAAGRLEEAVAEAERGLEAARPQSLRSAGPSIMEVLESAFAAGRLDRVDGLVAEIAHAVPADVTPSLQAASRRFRAKVDAATGADAHEIAAGFADAARIFRELKRPFDVAVVLTEHAEWLVEQGRDDEAASLFGKAREIFASLRATPWLDRVATTHQAEAVS